MVRPLTVARYPPLDTTEPPVQCYRFLETGEVTSIFTNIDGDGTATNKRRKVSIAQNELNVVQTSITTDGYGLEFVLKPPSEVIEGVQSDSGQEAPARASSGVARTRTRRFRQGRKRRILFRRKDDRELFREGLSSHTRNLLNLAGRLGQNPYIRCEHRYHDGRTFAFAFGYFRNGVSRKAVVALLWHTRTRPHRAVCVTFSFERNPSREGTDKLVANCSCCHLLRQNTESESGCYHAQRSLADEALTRVVSNEIQRGETLQEDGGEEFSIFGEPFHLERASEPSAQLTVLLDRGKNSKRTLASSWIFFLTFDLDLYIFTPVLKVKGKPYKCLLCRIPSSRRGVCIHEEFAKKACKRLRGQPGRGSSVLSDFGFMSGDDSDKERANYDNSHHSEIEEEEENVEENTGRNRSVSLPEVYTPHERRPILPS